MSLLLKSGENVAVPPAGHKSLILDANGDPFLLLPDGTRAALGGGGAGTVTTDGVTTDGDGSALDPIAGVPSSASNAGTMSAADKILANLLASDWAVAEAKLIQATGLAVTQFKRFPYGLIAPTISTPVASDGLVDGGSFKTTTLGEYHFLAQSTFQLPKTGPWSLSFKGKLLGGGVAAHDSFFGLVNTAKDHVWLAGRRQATSATKLVIRAVGSAGTTTTSSNGAINADSNQHVYRLAFDGTTARLYVDGVVDATLATLTQMADEPMYPMFYSTVAGEAVVNEILVGF